MNVLITSASRKVSLVNAFKVALALEGGGKVIAADISELAAALYMADGHCLVPADAAPGFILRMLEICTEYEIGLLIPTRDEELPIFAQHRQRFADIGVTVMVSSPLTVRTCQDKLLFYKFCTQHGFSAPRLYAANAAEREITYPLLVKPRIGKGSRGIFLINSRKEHRRVLEETPELLVQEFVRAQEYTIDLFADLNGRVISVVPRQRIVVLGGESFVGKTCRNLQLMDEAERLAVKLNLSGHNTLQCFLDGGCVKFIEVNPRFGGGAALSIAAGANSPLFLVRLLKGLPVAPVIGEFKNNYYMLRYTQEMFIGGT
ncbi:ATP-grasp domain-containing protein [Candidatus Magnetobacterium casense]|uniref:ATP-grasp domain-containing protein n=1 Tax=Candidatus Magnetobacterium casense TaxID=1455061 RepID=A0ABS6S290_9BACT|nr:ATP-grasp domain-containing protein [Candidatus Magnetobacterium casensis]MBV6342519.1 ATP-grasp domain-containing protein [Candidatus Magnetobacterium casensis]